MNKLGKLALARDAAEYRVYCLEYCVACGDKIGWISDQLNLHLQDSMRAYCKTCAKEVLGLDGRLCKLSPGISDAGGGRRVIRSTKPMS